MTPEQLQLKSETGSPEETEALGRTMGKCIRVPVVILLTGPLGAGKTVFARGVARGLGYRDYVRSPTFTLLHHYPGDTPIYHFDFYRLETVEELQELGIEEYFYGDGVSIVEWAERLPDAWPDDHVHVHIAREKAALHRTLVLTAVGEAPRELLESVCTVLEDSYHDSRN